MERKKRWENNKMAEKRGEGEKGLVRLEGVASWGWGNGRPWIAQPRYTARINIQYTADEIPNKQVHINYWCQLCGVIFITKMLRSYCHICASASMRKKMVLFVREIYIGNG